MAIEYLGLSEINGPLVVLEGVKNASFEEIVEFHMDDGTQKIGRIVEIYEDKAVIQVFEGTDNMSLGNTHTRLTGHPMEIGLSPEILGRTFNGIGQPIDGLGDITPEVSLNINGLPLNPVTREYPRNYINTGISAIIDPSGKVVSHTSWWQPEVLKGKVGLSDERTFFTIHGDFIGRISTLMAALVILAALVRRFAR